MKGRIRWAAAGLVLGLAAALTLPSFAQPSPTPGNGSTDRTVTVTGSATIRSAPDEAVVTLGVRTQATSAQRAMEENASKMTEVMKALLDLGIRQDDIATAGINLYPSYDENGQAVDSYTAENQVSVTVRDLNAIGRTIDEAVAAGANLASGIAFQLSDESHGVEDALRAAVANARSKGEVLAEAGDGSLGQVLHISETSLTPGPVFDRVEAFAGETPVSPPTLETVVSVTVTWALS